MTLSDEEIINIHRIIKEVFGEDLCKESEVKEL